MGAARHAGSRRWRLHAGLPAGGAARLLLALALSLSLVPATAAGLGDMLGALAGRSGEHGRDRDVDDALRRLAVQMNRTMPKDIDSEFRLEKVSAEPGQELVYHYTLREKRAADVPQAVFNGALAPAVRLRLCQDPQMQGLLKSGARIGYAYRGNDGGDIGKLSFSQHDCRKDS
jgi:hypothetical protein